MAQENQNFWRDARIYHKAFYGLLGVYAIIVGVTFQAYGITIDEPPQMAYGKAVFEWYLGIDDSGDVLQRIKDIDLELYGVLFDVVAYGVSLILPFDPYDSRHLVNAVFGMLSLVVVYRLGCVLGSPATGLGAALLLLMMPRYYGHAFNNPKDIPFAFFYVLSLYQLVCGVKELPDLSWQRLLKIGLSIGLTLGTRVGGLILFFYLGLGWLVRYGWLVFEAKDKRLIKKGVLQVGVIVGIAWVMMLAFWPRAQLEPFFYPFYALQYFSHFTHYNTTFFDGETIKSVEVPQYYALLWAIMILPELHMVCLVVGVVWLCINRRIFGVSVHLLLWGLIVFATLFPLFYVVLRHAPLYDGFRHLLFILPPLTVLCSGGVEKVIRSGVSKVKKITIGVLVILTLLTVWDMVRLHPYQYVYFNRIFAGGLSQASERFSTDYWENSYKEGLDWVEQNFDHADGRRLRIHAPTMNVQYLLDEAYYEFVEMPQNFDVYLSTTRDDGHKLVPGEIIHRIERDAAPLLYIIRPDEKYNDDPFFADTPLRKFNLAWKAKGAGNFEIALKVFQEMLPFYSRHPTLYNNIGGCYLELKQYEKAVEAFEHALAIDPQYLGAKIRLGMALSHLDRLDQSAEVLRDAVKQAPDNMDALQQLGWVLSQAGDLDESIAAFGRVLIREPNNGRIAGIVGLLLYQVGRNDEAIPMLQQAMQWKPEDVRFPLVLGHVYERVGQKNAAQKAYEHLLRIEPNHAEARARLTGLLKD